VAQQPAVSAALQRRRLTRLVGTGYFPSELPPPFTTKKLAAHAPALAASWSGADIRKFWTSPEHFTIPRYGQVRRKLAVVNPINQVHVAHLVAENWVDISARLKRSKITEFKPEILLQGGGRAVNGVDFDGVGRRRAQMLATYGRYVKTDIARFYPSVYTHSIAWSLLGKQWVKQHFTSSSFKTSFANLLDKAVAAGQAGQTIGIPIGPDTSRVLSELIATELEELWRATIPDLDIRAVRYVDDLLVGFAENETADAILSKLSAGLYEYELELSGEKTSVHGVGSSHAPEWNHYVRSYDFPNRPNLQRESLDSYFEQAVYLADNNPRDNVLLFAAKRAATFNIDDNNVDHLVRWLLYAARRSTTCLSFIVQHLSMLHAAKQKLPLIEIQSFIDQQIPLRAEAAHVAEVAWLLFWARELNARIDSKLLTRVLQLRSSVCALLVLDLNQRGAIVGPIDVSFWQSFANDDGLKSEMWLAAYEVTRKGWWTTPVSDTFFNSHKFFCDLATRNVEFYETRRRSRPQVGRPYFSMLAKAAAIQSISEYPG